MNPWKGLNNLPRNVWIVAFATLINRSGMMLIPFLTLYATTKLELSASKAGLVLLCFGLGAFISGPFVGKLSDKIGALKLMKLSLIVSGGFVFIYSLVDEFYLFLVLTFVWSTISEAFRPAAMSLLSDETTPEKRKTTFALYRLAINVGMSIGPVIGGILYAIDFALLFYVDAATSIAAGLFLIFVPFTPKEIVEKSEDEKTAPKNIGTKYLPDFKFLYFIIAVIPASIVMMQHFSVMPLFIVKDLGYNSATFGLLTAINTVVIIFVELPLNNWMNNWKNWQAIALGAILTGIGFGGMAFTTEIIGIAITIVIWTFGEMILFPAFAAMAADLSPENRRGFYMGFYQMGFGFSVTFGPVFSTTVYDNLGATTLWIASFFFALVTVVMILKFRNEEETTILE